MIELITIALAGSIIAGLWDLKTTEVPDEIPALMIAGGIFSWFIRFAFFGEYSGFFLSLFLGTLLLAFGLVLYKKGQWGGADAWILAAIGYLLPVYNGRVFIFDYVANFLVVSSIYMVVYALFLGAMDVKIFSYFPAELKAHRKAAATILVVFLVPIAAIAYTTRFANVVPLASSFLLVFLLVMFWVYAKVIEKYAFKKKIPVSDLRVGDVMEEMLWRGITAEELKEVRKKKKFVVIKEGVRFVPVFPITLVVTLLDVNLIFWAINLLS